MQMFGAGTSWSMGVRTAVLGTLLLASPSFCFAEAKPMPVINAKTLSGEAVRLPGTASGQVIVLVFGFTRSAKGEGEAWGKGLIEMQRERNNFNFFQIAMLSGAPRFTHGIITRAMRASVPAAYQPHMLLLTENGKQWRDLLDVTDDRAAYVVLCNPAGEIEWKTKGASKAQMDALRAQLHRDAK